jgi:hypothetical protein
MDDHNHLDNYLSLILLRLSGRALFILLFIVIVHTSK